MATKKKPLKLKPVSVPEKLETNEPLYVNVHQFWQPYNPSSGEIVVCNRIGWFEYDPNIYTDIDAMGIYLGDGRVMVHGQFKIKDLTEKSRKLVTENMNVSRMLKGIRFI